jgi:predicted transcriptional regulator
MSKKRYTLYISRPLARRFDLIAQQRNGAKSALVEEALRAALEPQQHAGLEEGLARRLNELNRVVAGLRREMAVATETLAIFVRYFLTVTPPLPQDEQEPARLLGRERYQVLLTEVGRRVAENERLVAEVIATIPVAQTDLFAKPPDDTSTISHPTDRNGHASSAHPLEENDHG